MRYPDSHWEQVAKRYTDEMAKIHPTELTGGKTMETVALAKTQDHYPYTSESTVRGWIKKCREKGLL